MLTIDPWKTKNGGQLTVMLVKVTGYAPVRWR